MPTSAEFNDLFDLQHPRTQFESATAYNEYRRTAYHWYSQGKNAKTITRPVFCNLCGGRHYTVDAAKLCGALWNSTKDDKE